MLFKTLVALLALAFGSIAVVPDADAKTRVRKKPRKAEADWVLLATRSVDLTKDRERFEIGAGKGRFKSVRVTSPDRPITVYRVTVTAAEGEPYIHGERMRLDKGEPSQPVKFSYEARPVRHVEMLYRPDYGAVRPVKVEVWGERSSLDKEETPYGANWEWVGTRGIDLDKESGSIEIGANKGRFKSLMLVSANRLIRIERITVVTDGEPFVMKERIRLDRGQRTQPIAFSRDGRPVRRIDLSYHTHLGASGPANIEVWGIRTSAGVPTARSEPPPASVSPSRVTSPAAAASAPQEAETDGAGAVLFGIQEVGSGTDQDVFKLGREYGRFGRIRLRVTGNAVEIKQMRVVYTGGEPDVLALDTEVAANEMTRWFDLKGDRFIREIQFVYSSESRRKARLEVYGEYADSWFRPGLGTGAFSSANNGWLYLGGQSPLFVSIRRGLGYETDVVSVARNRGFKSLRLDVKNRAITLNQIKVIYADDSADTFAERRRIDGGASFGPVELQSRRPVKRIEISYRSRIFDSQAESSSYAFVEFWAK